MQPLWVKVPIPCPGRDSASSHLSQPCVPTRRGIVLGEKTVASHRIGFKPSLDWRLGMGNYRWWRWFIAPSDERTTAPDKRLVHFVFGHCGLPANGGVVTEMCGYQAVRSCSDPGCKPWKVGPLAAVGVICMPWAQTLNSRQHWLCAKQRAELCKPVQPIGEIHNAPFAHKPPLDSKRIAGAGG